MSFAFLLYFCNMMKIWYPLIWLSRLPRSCGFGIQSPTDFQFVQDVLRERLPYYAYASLEYREGRVHRRIGLMVFRIANWRQPGVIIDGAGMSPYLLAACPHATIVQNADAVELAVVSVATNYQSLFDHCDDRSVVVFTDIQRHQPLWKCILHDERVRVSYDLYHCGVVLFDSKRIRVHYSINM